MTIETDVLCEMWLVVKEYIPQKDRQAVADHVVNVIADHNITEKELKTLGGTDKYLKNAVFEYLGDVEEDVEDDE